MKISHLKVSGWKSIRELDLELRDINILIGANGSGKSNFVALFSFLNNVVEGRLQEYVAQKGGANKFFYFGSKQTSKISIHFEFSSNGYSAKWIPTIDDRLVFLDESVWYLQNGERIFEYSINSSGREESRIQDNNAIRNSIRHYVRKGIESWVAYHFHDTGETSPLKRTNNIHDNRGLRRDGANLAAFLYLLQQQHPKEFKTIEYYFSSKVPAFDRFKLEPARLNTDTIRLEWQAKGSDMFFDIADLSDGSLRFLALLTVFLQPSPPDTIIIDEPEMGLHPDALGTVARLVQKVVAQGKQVFLSTQSADLLNYFEPEDVLVSNYTNNETTVKRLSSIDLKEWLSEYTLSELWEKNILEGKP